ncbi:AAA family ATPase [Archangium primigenium]|uniref:AAA family ATPase n=1 Tax=[Archangium] primigenium TaxID=2792470 RepID=UPI00195766EA|nr:adenylate/guanylate cyclase domain-containing protein [Archangium primigenium]MBM7112330.1 AAA family ATPase [Archangium primigenium]
MTSHSRSRALAAFLPGSLVRALQEDDTRPREGAWHEQPGAVLFADLTGFTALAETLDRGDPSGAEQLRGILDACFSQLIGTLRAHGGDVLRFAGDALVALWPAESWDGLPRAVERAAHCALEAQALLEAAPPQGGVRTRLKVGIGAGRVRLSDVCGEQGHWDFLASGEPLLEMTQAEQTAQPGEIILGPQASRHLPHARGEPRGPVGFRLTGLPPLAPSPVRAVEPPPHLESALRAYLPRIVSLRLEAGHGQWLSEFRTVTVLFINLGGPALAAGHHPAELQHTSRILQAILFRHGGSAHQMVVDDKGVVMVAAFGLPLLSHEDDAVRAVLATLEMRAALRERGMPYRLGVATGRVFCGTIGSDTRHEYVMVGHTVNLAARLMQAAVDDVLCDGATLARSSERLRFELLPPLKMKGITQPVPIFRPHENGLGPDSRRGLPVVGREPERAQLAAAVRALADTGTGRTLLIDAEAGMGKSVLVDEALEGARALGVSTAQGEGTSEERARAYHAWRPVLARLLGLEAAPDPGARAAILLERLRHRPEHVAWAPLLNGVLPVQLPEGDGLQHMTAALRGSNTRELLVQLLDDACRERPRMVVLDDAHWMDSASWELALAAQRRVRRLLLVLCARPPTETADTGHRQLREAPGTRLLTLGRMPEEDVLALVCQRLGARRLPGPMVTLLRERAEGHPFFGEQLACALRDAGHLVVERGDCRWAPGPGGTAPPGLPSTIQGLLISRMDRLTPQQQLTLKVASVLGRAFPLVLLRDIHPVASDRESLAEQLDALHHLGLVQPQKASAQGPEYAFQHILIQEAAYHLMAFAQRRELHRAVAEHHERAEHSEERLPLLAHHWHRAEQPERALSYLERAAETASGRGAPREAIALLTQALALATGGAPPLGPLRATRWNARLAQAHHALGDMDTALAHADRALALLGDTRPTTRWAWGRRLVREGGQHLVGLALSRGCAATGPDEHRERLTLAAGLFSLLAEQSFYDDRLLESMACNFAAVNRAEAVRAFSTAAVAYNALGYMAGMGRSRPLARHYFRRAATPGPSPHTDVVEGAYHLTFGRWEEGLGQVERGIAAARRINDCFTQCTGLEVLGMGLELARAPGAAQAVRETMLQVATEAASAVNTMWALSEMATTLLHLARPREAAERLREAQALLPRSDPLAVLRYHCNAALVAHRTGEDIQARGHAHEALRMLRARPVVVWSDVTSLSALAQACLELWEDAQGASAAVCGEFRALTRDALRVLVKAGRLYPTARSRAERLAGTSAWLEGRRERAVRLWRRALASAREHRLPTDEALAHQALARAAPPTSATRAVHRHQARRLFEHLGAHGLIQALDRWEYPSTLP